VKYGVHGFTAFTLGISARTGFGSIADGAGCTLEVATSGMLVLPYTASSVGVARRRLIGDLAEAGVSENTACDAGLVISELISNALRHATPLPGNSIEVSWGLRVDSVTVAVTDGGAETLPRVHRPTGSSLGGRGLGIVDRLSVQWGVQDGRGGLVAAEDVLMADENVAGENVADQNVAGRNVTGEGVTGEDAAGDEPGMPSGIAVGLTVWAELPVEYASVPALVIASSRDA
jgi:anti-sigma regulatory factor (Ser/Thr protein kinase)